MKKGKKKNKKDKLRRHSANVLSARTSRKKSTTERGNSTTTDSGSSPVHTDKEHTSKKNKHLEKPVTVKLAMVYSTDSKAPVSGSALYYVTKQTDTHATLLHPVTLQTFTLGRRDFETGISDVFLPKPEVTTILKCDPTKIGDLMLKQMEKFTNNSTQYSVEVVRTAVADLKEIPLDEVPLFKNPNILTGWRVNGTEWLRKRGELDDQEPTLTGWRKRATETLIRWGTLNPSDESTKGSQGNLGRNKAPKIRDLEPGTPYRADTALAILYRALKDGKPQKTKALQELVQAQCRNVKSRLRRLRREGQQNGWNLKEKGEGLWQLKLAHGAAN